MSSNTATNKSFEDAFEEVKALRRKAKIPPDTVSKMIAPYKDRIGILPSTADPPKVHRFLTNLVVLMASVGLKVYLEFNKNHPIFGAIKDVRKLVKIPESLKEAIIAQWERDEMAKGWIDFAIGSNKLHQSLLLSDTASSMAWERYDELLTYLGFREMRPDGTKGMRREVGRAMNTHLNQLKLKRLPEFPDASFDECLDHFLFEFQQTAKLLNSDATTRSSEEQLVHQLMNGFPAKNERTIKC